MGSSLGSSAASLGGSAAGAGLTGALGLPLATAGPIGLGIYALGSALQYAGQRNQEKEQQKIQGEIQDQEQGAHASAGGAVGDALARIKNTGPTQSGATLASEGNFANALKGVVGTTGAPAVPGASPRYAAANARNVTQSTPTNTGVNEYAAQLVPAIATQNGTGQAARLGQQAIGNASANVANLQSQAYADQVAGNLASQDITQNPYSTVGAQMLHNLGQGMATARVPSTPQFDPFAGVMAETTGNISPNYSAALQRSVWGY